MPWAHAHLLKFAVHFSAKISFSTAQVLNHPTTSCGVVKYLTKGVYYAPTKFIHRDYSTTQVHKHPTLCFTFYTKPPTSNLTIKNILLRGMFFIVCYSKTSSSRREDEVLLLPFLWYGFYTNTRAVALAFFYVYSLWWRTIKMLYLFGPVVRSKFRLVSSWFQWPMIP